jgi:cytochrome c biogenesis protein CcmG/thiol:disulfide interchange protein DsbE
VALVIGLIQYSTSVPGQDSSVRLTSPGFVRPPALDLPVLRLGDHAGAARIEAGRDGTVSLTNLRGSAVVVNFWASWCRPCREEARLLERLAHKWASRGVVVLGVNQNDELGDARRFLDTFGIDYPTVRESGDGTARRWRVRGFPVTYFINRAGHAVAASIGLLDAASLEAGLSRATSGTLTTR